MGIGNLIAAGLGAGSKLIGGIASDKSNKKLQMKFAKNAIQWKTQDALKAGIHPLYALGAPTMSPSVSLGQTGAAFSDMGQDISRAIEAGGNAEDRTLRKLQLDRAGLENELLKSQIARSNQALAATVASPVGADSVIPGQQQISVGGVGIKQDKLTTGAQAWQNRYGEPGEWVGAPLIAWQDMKKNLQGKSFLDILKMIDRATSIGRVPFFKKGR